MKVFVYEHRDLDHAGTYNYVIPANTQLGACRKWNKAHPNDLKVYPKAFREISDDSINKFGIIKGY